MSRIKSIIRAATRDDNKLNIGCCSTFERTEAFLAESMPNYTFWSFQSPQWKKWNKNFAPVMPNYVLLNEQKDPREQLPPHIKLDLFHCQNRMAQYPFAKSLCDYYGISLIVTEHNTAHPSTQEAFKRQMRSMVGDKHVYVTSLVRDSWGFSPNTTRDRIIHNAVDPDLFKRDESVEKKYVLTVANDFVGRNAYVGYDIWAETVQYLRDYKISVKLVGDTKELGSIPAKNTQELVKFYNEAYCLLSTTTCSSLPTTLIECQSCGVVPVSLPTTCIPSLLIKHGYNGFLGETPKELADYCRQLYFDADLRKQMSQNAISFIRENFNSTEFINKYKEIFQECAEMRK